MSVLDGKSAFVTGSTQGIGRAMAEALVRAGARVVLHGLREDEAAASAVRACKGADLVTSDLSSDLPASVSATVDRALEHAADIDLLVCNAGTFIDQPFLEMDFAVFERTMRLNVSSQFLLIQHFARIWQKQNTPGRIVVTGSINGRLSEPCHVAYDTSKGAVEALVRSLAVTLAPLGIRVNGVAPGLLRTPLTASAIDEEPFQRWMQHHTPNGRIPGPEAIGGTTVFLLSDEAEHIHGQMIFVDGGMSVWQQPDPPDHWA